MMSTNMWKILTWGAFILSFIANSFMVWDGHILADHRERIEALEAAK